MSTSLKQHQCECKKGLNRCTLHSQVLSDFEKNCKHLQIGVVASAIGLGLVIAGLVSNYWMSGFGFHFGIFYRCHIFGCISHGDPLLGVNDSIWWKLLVIGGIAACVCLALALAIRLYQISTNTWTRSCLTIQTWASVIGSIFSIGVLGFFILGSVVLQPYLETSWGLHVFAAGALFNILVVSVESYLQSKAFRVHQD